MTGHRNSAFRPPTLPKEKLVFQNKEDVQASLSLERFEKRPNKRSQNRFNSPDEEPNSVEKTFQKPNNVYDYSGGKRDSYANLAKQNR